MLSYLLKRVGSSLVMLVIISILIFVALRMLPGDPTTVALAQGDGVTEDAIANMRAELGLDKPVLVQYWQWVSGFISGDFGYSYFSKYAVSELIGQRLPATISLTVAALVLAIVIAVIAAVVPVLLRSKWLERIVNLCTAAGMAAPVFVIGILLVLFFANLLGWLPSGGYVSFERNPAKAIRYLVLPALTLSLAIAPQLIRYLQGSIDEVRWASFVRTARGKGIGWRRTVSGHVLPNALLPALTSLGITVGSLLGGSVVVEAVFAWPGIGQLVIDAVNKRDYAVIQTVVLLAAAVFVVVTLIVDLLYGILDPRLRVAPSRRAAAAPKPQSPELTADGLLPTEERADV
ncbi:ABC transporter permease [Nakamurella lactea]|uniref:ABC transporter permease n=1 Tax=Nakamurella lactea TaxID=459515 RepID=UPI000420D1A5|nr:ABC transporter permease [Nakamurella lactea]